MAPTSNILVLTAGSLGDALVTLPALQALAGLGTVTVAGTPTYLQLGAQALGVDRVLPLDEILQAENPPRGFDEAFLFFKYGCEALALRWGSNGPALRIPPFTFEQFLFRPRPAHFYWNTVVENAHPGRVFVEKPILRERDLLREKGRELLGALSLKNPLVIHPGSGGRTKNAPLDFFHRAAAAAGKGDHGVLVVWGEAEKDRLSEIQGAFKDMKGVRVLENPLPLADLAGVLANAFLYLGCDSGVTHLASACGTPVFALFGPTDPQVWAPPGANVFCADKDFRDVDDALAAFLRWKDSKSHPLPAPPPYKNTPNDPPQRR